MSRTASRAAAYPLAGGHLRTPANAAPLAPPPPPPNNPDNSKLPTHHPEDRNSVYPPSSAASGGAAPGTLVGGCATGGGAAEMVAATSGAVGSVDPKAQDLQFLFLAMTEEVGAGTWRAGPAGRQRAAGWRRRWRCRACSVPCRAAPGSPVRIMHTHCRSSSLYRSMHEWLLSVPTGRRFASLW